MAGKIGTGEITTGPRMPDGPCAARPSPSGIGVWTHATVARPLACTASAPVPLTRRSIHPLLDHQSNGRLLVTLRYGLDIRAVTPAEAPGLSDLLAEAGHVVDARDLAERLPSLRTTSGTALVALKWGPPSGLVVLHWYPTLHTARPIALITLLLVSVEERRQGIGRLLVKAAAQAARSAGCGDLTIMASPDAPSVQEFCRATGFADAGTQFTRSLRKQG